MHNTSHKRRNLTSTVFKIYAELVASAGCFVSATVCSYLLTEFVS